MVTSNVETTINIQWNADNVTRNGADHVSRHYEPLDIHQIKFLINFICLISVKCPGPLHALDFVSCLILFMGLLPYTQTSGLRMRQECRERFPRHRGLAIPTCITARALRTYRDACRDR